MSTVASCDAGGATQAVATASHRGVVLDPTREKKEDGVGEQDEGSV